MCQATGTAGKADQAGRLRQHNCGVPCRLAVAPVAPCAPFATAAQVAAQVSVLVAVLTLAGCASAPPRPAAPLPQPRPAAGVPAVALPPPADPGRDGPGTNPPPDLLAVPDAEPRLEPVRAGGPNKPYEVLGQAYVPLAGDPPLLQRGLASWYGRKFHGRSTANGETYNMYAMSAAHRTMPLPSYARVRNPANGREVVVRVNDRGPFHSDRVIDLSYTAAARLGVLGGVAPVEIERITYESIRLGSWRTPQTLALGPADTSLGAAPAPLAPALLAMSVGNNSPPANAPLPSAVPLPPETAAPAQAAAKAAPGFWLQLGAFAQRDGALGFQQRVAREVGWLAPLLAIFNERSLHRLQAGPYASRGDARQAAERLREALNLVPAVVERR